MSKSTFTRIWLFCAQTKLTICSKGYTRITSAVLKPASQYQTRKRSSILWSSCHGNKWCRNLPPMSRCFHDMRCEPEPPHVESKKQVIHGTQLEDEFAWIEDPAQREKLENYLEQEMRYTEKILHKSSSLQKQFVQEMLKFSSSMKTLDPFFKRTKQYEYWRERQINGSFLYLRKRIDKGEKEYVLDTSVLLKRHRLPLDSSVSDMKISLCEQYAACMVADGDENYVTYIVKLGNVVSEYVDVIPRTVRFEFGRNGAIFYTKPSTKDSIQASQVWRHQIGQSSSEDNLMYEEADDRFFVDLYATTDGQYISIMSSTIHSQTEIRLIDTKQDQITPTLVWPRRQGLVYFVEHSDDMLYVLANLDHNWQVYKVPVQSIPSNPTTEIETLYETSFEKVGGIEIIGDFCVVSVLDWVQGLKLMVKSLKGLAKPQQEVKLGSSICVINDAPNIKLSPDEAYFSMTTPTQPPVFYSFHPATLTVSKLPGQDESEEFKNLSCVKTESIGKDGTRIPITLVCKQDVVPHRRNPLLVIVYGAHGQGLDMGISAELMPLLERGWVIAYCHVRGGNELGQKWIDDGRQLKKPNTFEDFETCILHLHKLGYSQPALTAAYGISAGALPVAVLCNNSPGLIKSAILEVPYVDVLSTMLDPSLHLTTQDYEEYGDPLNDQQVFHTIKNYCPYFNIKSQPYPSLYVSVGLEDKRVLPQVPIKYVAKMRSVQRCRNSSHANDNSLTLLMVHDDRGHFASDTNRYDQVAKSYAFLYQAMDLPQR